MFNTSRCKYANLIKNPLENRLLKVLLIPSFFYIYIRQNPKILFPPVKICKPIKSQDSNTQDILRDTIINI